MFSLFQRSESQQPISATKVTERVASKLEAGKTAVEGTAAALAVVGIAATGPAIPAVLAAATIALVLARAYAQTKTLGKEFTQTYKVLVRVKKFLLRLKAVSERRNLPIEVSDLVDAIAEIERIVAKFAAPKVLSKIQEILRQGELDPASIKTPDGPIAMAKSMFGRWVMSARNLDKLKEARNNLALQLSAVTAEFSLALDDPANADLVTVPPATPPPPQQVGDEVGKAEVVAQTPDPSEETPATGGRRTRRRSKRSRKTTRKSG
jgi:hypothetical protein